MDDADLAALLAEVRRIEVQSRRLVTGVLAGSYRSVFRGAGLEFESVREYVEGDDPRSVDWNVTARVGRPFVKTFVDERELTVLFVLDLSASMRGGFGALSARASAARVIACLGLSAVENGDRVGLVAFGDRVETLVEPRRGVPHALRIVRDALALPERTGPVDARAALATAARAARPHSTVFVISDFLDAGWRTPLAVCARRHDVVAVRVLPPELAPPARAGLLRARDPETGDEHTLDLGNARVRAAYARRVDAWRAGSADEIRRAGVDRVDVALPRERDGGAIVRPLLRFFRMRERRGEKR